MLEKVKSTIQLPGEGEGGKNTYISVYSLY